MGIPPAAPAEVRAQEINLKHKTERVHKVVLQTTTQTPHIIVYSVLVHLPATMECVPTPSTSI